MKKEISGVLKINWFHKKWNIYDRDDWIQINILKNAIRMDDWDNEPNLYEFKNKYEVIWFLALRWIINRLI
jgi:hypothetical protein